MSNTKTVMSQAANTLAKPLEVEDVFSTYLYTGNGSTQTITNGIDLDGEGGLVWFKSRPQGNHNLMDTERGNTKYIRSNTTDTEGTNTNYITSFNSNGFTLGPSGTLNGTQDYASWTFRKAPRFFDVVTYTGTGSAGLTIDHSLGSVPGSIIVKRLNSTNAWTVYHRSLGNNKKLELNKTDSIVDIGNSIAWNTTTPTDTQFYLGADGGVNGNGGTYVAYLFAHNDGDGKFGGEADADIIKCGSYTGDGTTDGSKLVDLGFEPQFLIIKNTSVSENWLMIDSMRGASYDNTNVLFSNLSQGESTNGRAIWTMDPNGFRLSKNNSDSNESGNNYIYMAIRRGTKAPESATEVFDVGLRSGSSSDANTTSDILTDASIIMRRDSSSEYNLAGTRLQGLNNLFPESTSAEGAGAIDGWDTMSGLIVNGSNGAVNTGSLVDFSWKRAPGFFDVVAYTGNGTAGRTVSHNLTVAPEMIWVKRRNANSNWSVYHSAIGNDKYIVLNTTNTPVTSSTFWNNTDPTASSYTVGTANGTNNTNDTYIAYLFASLPGISKVGSYTGNGTSQNIDCGFTSGARFVLIKNASQSDNWMVYDSVRGIVSGNDPYLRLNSTAAEYTSGDHIDPYSGGFAATSNDPSTNRTGNTYIFYAIA